jgi:hypothetical protein
VWRYCCDVFDYLALGAIVDGRVFCVHGGLSPQVVRLDQVSSTLGLFSLGWVRWTAEHDPGPGVEWDGRQ